MEATTKYRDAYGDTVDPFEKIVQLGDGSWLIASQRDDGRWEAPCRPHVGSEFYFGSLAYVSGPRSAVYRYARRRDAVRAVVRLFGLTVAG
jgi:hypothetical protein